MSENTEKPSFPRSSNSVSRALMVHNRPLSVRSLLSDQSKEGTESERHKSDQLPTNFETEDDEKSLLVRRGSAPPKVLTPANASEQLRILQSFELVPDVPDISTAIDAGFDWNRWTDIEKYLEGYGPNELPKPELESYFSLWIGAFYDIMVSFAVPPVTTQGRRN